MSESLEFISAGGGSSLWGQGDSRTRTLGGGIKKKGHKGASVDGRERVGGSGAKKGEKHPQTRGFADCREKVSKGRVKMVVQGIFQCVFGLRTRGKGDPGLCREWGGEGRRNVKPQKKERKRLSVKKGVVVALFTLRSRQC